MPKRIIMDCDPGHDDAIALLLAHGSPEIELLAVTTVVGNQTLDKVTRLRGPAPDGCTTRVGVALDRNRFWDLLIDALERIGDVAA